jgi:hypothetical protein
MVGSKCAAVDACGAAAGVMNEKIFAKSLE